MAEERDYVIFDLEFTGFNVHVHEILDIGAVRIGADLRTSRGEFTAKLRPHRIDQADRESLRVSHYTKDGWKDALEPKDALVAFSRFAKGAIPVGFNAAWDWAFLLAACYEHGVGWKFLDYHVVDVLSMVYAQGRNDLSVDDLALGAMCERYDVAPPEDAHHAIDDARATLRLFQAVSVAQRG